MLGIIGVLKDFDKIDCGRETTDFCGFPRWRGTPGETTPHVRVATMGGTPRNPHHRRETYHGFRGLV